MAVASPAVTLPAVVGELLSEMAAAVRDGARSEARRRVAERRVVGGPRPAGRREAAIPQGAAFGSSTPRSPPFLRVLVSRVVLSPPPRVSKK